MTRTLVQCSWIHLKVFLPICNHFCLTYRNQLNQENSLVTAKAIFPQGRFAWIAFPEYLHLEMLRLRHHWSKYIKIYVYCKEVMKKTSWVISSLSQWTDEKASSSYVNRRSFLSLIYAPMGRKTTVTNTGSLAFILWSLFPYSVHTKVSKGIA